MRLLRLGRALFKKAHLATGMTIAAQLLSTSLATAARASNTVQQYSCVQGPVPTKTAVNLTQLTSDERGFLRAAPRFIPMLKYAGEQKVLEELHTQLALPDTDCSPREQAQADLLRVLFAIQPASADAPFTDVIALQLLYLYADGFLPETMWRHGLTKLEAVALYSYTTEDYQLLNPELRKLQPIPEALNYAALVNKALDRFPKFQGLVKRGLSLPDNQLPFYEAGNQIVLPAFTSTTADLTFGAFEQKHRFLILSCAGRDISSISANPGEQEVLFKAGSHFEVLEVRQQAPLHGFVAEREFRLKEIGCTGGE